MRFAFFLLLAVFTIDFDRAYAVTSVEVLLRWNAVTTGEDGKPLPAGQPIGGYQVYYTLFDIGKAIPRDPNANNGLPGCQGGLNRIKCTSPAPYAIFVDHASTTPQFQLTLTSTQPQTLCLSITSYTVAEFESAYSDEMCIDIDPSATIVYPARPMDVCVTEQILTLANGMILKIKGNCP